MVSQITQAYQHKDAKKSQLLKLKNKCFATIYGMALSGKPVREIHRALLKQTINERKVFAFMVKVANRTVKAIDPRKTVDANGALLLLLFNRERYNSKVKKVINQEVTDDAEAEKQVAIADYVDKSREAERWFYLASSHNDSAEDHAPWQGRLYYDEKAPKDVREYAEKHRMKSIQWVMGAPVYFITRPNCRHFFKSLPMDVIKKYSNKDLIRRYKMHRMDGDRSLATPAKIAVEEYEDRLHMLQGMYKEHQTEHLRREIQKTKLLIKKWKKIL